MQELARLLTTTPPQRIEVDGALSDELIEDLTAAGFTAVEADGVAKDEGIEVRFVEVTNTDARTLTAFLTRWNVKERG